MSEIFGKKGDKKEMVKELIKKTPRRCKT